MVLSNLNFVNYITDNACDCFRTKYVMNNFRNRHVCNYLKKFMYIKYTYHVSFCQKNYRTILVKYCSFLIIYVVWMVSELKFNIYYRSNNILKLFNTLWHSYNYFHFIYFINYNLVINAIHKIRENFFVKKKYKLY